MRVTDDFHKVVLKLSEHEVIPIAEDHPVLNILSRGLDALVDKSKYTLYRRKRVNEVGKSLEREVYDILDNNQSVDIAPYSQHVGYPDMFGRIPGHAPFFVEVKITAVREDDTDSQRRFYLSSGRKIKNNGHHLLILLYMREDGDAHRLKAWRINDLYDLQISLKREYNAGSDDFARLRTLRHS